MLASLARQLQARLISKRASYSDTRISTRLQPGASSTSEFQASNARGNKLTVLQTPIRFYPAIGGVENHVYYLSKELAHSGNTVKVICANEPPSNENNVQAVLVERLAYPFKVTNTNITFSLPFSILRSQFDILHTHMPTPWSADWSVLLARLLKKRSVITLHNDMDKPGFLAKLVTRIYLFSLFKLTLTLVDSIIIVNPHWENSFVATKKLLLPFKKKISIIPNGIDLTLFKPASGVVSKKNSLLFISILDKHHEFKGLDYLLDALKMLKRDFPDIQLTIVGEGELKRHYQRKAVLLNLGENVSFVGEVKQEELVSYYNAASLFILPSTEIEGFGIVLLEAMACHVPVIATSIVGTSGDIKKYNAGIVVEPRKADELAQAITTILNQPALAEEMGRNGRRLVEEKYDWKNIARQIESIYLK
jgi:glycosyltransferase involved in cell wall biosynthesis